MLTNELADLMYQFDLTKYFNLYLKASLFEKKILDKSLNDYLGVFGNIAHPDLITHFDKISHEKMEQELLGFISRLTIDLDKNHYLGYELNYYFKFISNICSFKQFINVLGKDMTILSDYILFSKFECNKSLEKLLENKSRPAMDRLLDISSPSGDIVDSDITYMSLDFDSQFLLSRLKQLKEVSKKYITLDTYKISIYLPLDYHITQSDIKHLKEIYQLDFYEFWITLVEDFETSYSSEFKPKIGNTIDFTNINQFINAYKGCESL